jgi:hypothetical protein
VVERRGEGLISNTVASIQQPRHPKLGFKRENFVQRFSAVEYLQKLGGDFASPLSANC